MTMTCPPTWTSSVTNLRAAYALLCEAGMDETYSAQVGAQTALRSSHDFASLAHAHQEPPPCANNGGPWTTWLVLGGRGAGKTRLGAEWVRAMALGRSPYAQRRQRSI